MLLSKRMKLAACAGMQGVVFDISDRDEPERVSSFTSPGVTGWHSAKSYFCDTKSGDLLGTWVLPRAQSAPALVAP